MNRILTAIAIVVALLSAACGKQESRAASTYPMTATIVTRDAAANTLLLDNKEVPGRMAAMKMAYELRGANVESAPPDGTPVVVTVHDSNGSYYISDVKRQK